MSFLPRNRLLALTSLPLALGLAGCFDMDMTINGEEGVPLSELDMVGAAPVELVLAGSDNVILTRGDTLRIEVEGGDEAVAALRFALDDKTLGIMRDGNIWEGSDAATIRVTMPAPSEIVISGSGNIEAQDLAENADISIQGSGKFTGGDAELNSLEINIGGSGSAEFGTLTVQAVEVTLGGSGSVSASGKTDRLEVNLGGSGDADFSGLKADDAEISIAGSGSVSLQSEGEVEASIMGSGSVSVKGDAKCTETASGSGSLSCSS